MKQAKEEAKKNAADKKAGQPSLIPIPQKHPVAVVPVFVSIKMSPSQFALYESLWEQVRKSGNVSADKTEALLEIMKTYVMMDSGTDQPAETGQQNNHQQNKRHSAQAKVQPTFSLALTITLIEQPAFHKQIGTKVVRVLYPGRIFKLRGVEPAADGKLAVRSCFTIRSHQPDLRGVKKAVCRVQNDLCSVLVLRIARHAIVDGGQDVATWGRLDP